MDRTVFEQLLYRGESETLDFKVDQYSFSGPGVTEDEKSKLLKDILNVPYGKAADPQKLALHYIGEPILMRFTIFARDQAEIRGLVRYSMEEIEAKAL